MFIRRTQTRNRISGEPYVTYRLVHSTRVGNAIKQTTLLNLGAHFDLPQVHWPALAQHIDELVHGQRSMLDTTLPEEVQVFAQRFAAQIIARTPARPLCQARARCLRHPQRQRLPSLLPARATIRAAPLMARPAKSASRLATKRSISTR